MKRRVIRGTVRERLNGHLAPCAIPGCNCSGCLLWTGCLNSRGYGVISVDGQRKLVHRVAWSLDNGPVPDGLTIDHVHDRGCRHKACALVAHLEPVTTKENTRRWHVHGRHSPRPYRSRIAEPDPAYLAALNAFFEEGGPSPEDLGLRLTYISPA